MVAPSTELTDSRSADRASGASPAAPRPESWFSGHLPQLKRDVLGFFTQCEREFGPVVPLRLYHEPFLLVNDPVLIQRILVTDHANFWKPTGLSIVKPMFGEGILTSEDDLWRSQRAMIQPAFHKQCVDRYAEVVVPCANTLFEAWEREPVRDMYVDMGAVTLDVVARSLFGADVVAGRAAVVAAADGIQDFFASWRRHYLPLPTWLPFPAHNRLRRAVREVDRCIYELIATREARQDKGRDFLGMLLEASRPDGSKMSHRALRDELVTLFLAGHETSAATLSWSLYELVKHPGVYAKLQEELDRVLSGRPLTVQSLRELPYLDDVVKEIMRLYPAAYNIGRIPKEPFELAGHRVRAGQNVIMCQWAVQRSYRYYDDPDAFMPERWGTERARSIPKFAYFPFGGGARNCIGAQFAQFQVKLTLASVLQNYDLELLPHADVVVDPAMTLRPLRGMPMRVRRRLAPSS